MNDILKSIEENAKSFEKARSQALQWQADAKKNGLVYDWQNDKWIEMGE